jgi:hypothetical protein
MNKEEQQRREPDLSAWYNLLWVVDQKRDQVLHNSRMPRMLTLYCMVRA